MSGEDAHATLEGGAPPRTRSWRRVTAVALLGLLAAVLAVLTVLAYLRLRELRDSESAAAEALAAARAYAPDMLSYDYRTVEADLARARGYATGNLAGHYGELSRVLVPVVKREQTVQQAAVAAAAVESATPDRVQVLLFMNMGTTRLLPGDEQPHKQVVQNRARFVLVKGQEHWLVSELSTLIGNAPGG
ncbi:hypothetical protein Sme01_74650 [Sphaerisporangium melleum]|uniref:Mce-associated membrane protein n=1 Tax=Sphaerisporangium melleum TaxID=321316 RepID=A0A917VW90_9ACTN|nr:hypothetical protein [Sphaerisporangium melleum]GGL21434.1 hypothetical protein GCM10007964_74200 [Sphaerisporangium melleum]GII74989.1 hypothetical protein Sme01_74650 [Sphaerisporangium melleum]